MKPQRVKESEMSCSHRGDSPSRLGKACIVKTTSDRSTNILDLVAHAKPVRDSGTDRESNVKEVIQKVLKRMGWHKRKLQLFERGPARRAGRVALQPHLETFLVVRVLTFWG